MHEPVRREIDVPELEVIGDVPADLTGIYLRNGPNQRHDPLGVHHWFDGDGMLHGVVIRDGSISYRNRWVRTRGMEQENRAGHSVWPGLIDPPNRTLERAWGSDGCLKDSSNTDVVFHNGKAVTTFYQCGEPYLLNPYTLETTGCMDLNASGARAMSAHNMVDERTGEMMFFDYATVEPYMTYGVLDASGRLSHFTPIELPGPRLPHTLAITENYTILMDLPLFWDPELLKQGAHKVTFHSELPSRFGIIPRHGEGSSIRWFEAEPCYIYHIVNAWEEDGEIVMEACRFAHPEPSQEIRRRYAGPYANLLAWMRMDTTYHRWRFNLETGACSETPLSDMISEFPMIQARYYGLPSRYSYHVTFAEAQTVLFDGLVKYDSRTGAVQQHRFEPGYYGSESPFATRDGASAEDDGYVVSFVSIPSEKRAELQIFDARDIEAGAVCRALIPQRVASGFHSCWVPGDLMPSPDGQ
jgi:carotenoid cleavage dioxygenase